MQYMLLIYDDERAWASLSDEERGGIYQEYSAFTDDLRTQGKLVTANQLQPTATATTVTVNDGDTVVTDGPFAETKEALGGYYVVEAESLDDAIEIAARIPSARIGKIEVRPVVLQAAEVQAG
jgi:hypothetical protein